MHWILHNCSRRIAESLIYGPLIESRHLLRHLSQRKSHNSVINHKQSKTFYIYILLYLTLTMSFDRTEGFVLRKIGQPPIAVVPPHQLFSTRMLSADIGLVYRTLNRGTCLLCRILSADVHPSVVAPKNLDPAVSELKTQKYEQLQKKKRRTSSGSVSSSNDDSIINGYIKRTSGAQDPDTQFAAVHMRKRRNVGDRRITKLYCRTGYILQIHNDGQVGGSYDSMSKLGLLEIQAVGKGGQVRIQSRANGRFLAMTRSGKLYGANVYDPERSDFVERIVEGWYNTYAVRNASGSKRRRDMYVGISKGGKPKKGNKVSQTNKAAHFLPLRTT